MPSYDLGTARGRIDIDASGAERGLGRVSRQQDILSRGAGSTAFAIRNTGFALLGIGGAAVAGFGLAVKTAANFEKGISAIGAVSGASKEQLDQLRKKALQLGADTKFSASEAATAMEELAKAGVSVDDIMHGAADATVALAAAGEIDLPQAATIAANAMNQFNLSAKDLPRVADLISGAANASAIDVSDFGLSMQQAGASANLVGLDFADLAVAIAAMGNAGIRGSDAGTSLKTFLSNLQPTTKKQIDLMKELGLVTEDGGNKFFDAAGHIKSMADISGTLADALKGQTDQQKTMTLETIFGSDAIRAAAIVANTGKKGFEDLSASMGKVKAADVAAARMDNFSGSMEQLKGSLETLIIQIGTPFLSILKSVADALTKFVNFLSAVPESLQKTIAFVVLGTGALIGLAGALLLAYSFVSKLRETIEALKLATFFTNPVFLAILAIAALVLGLVLLYKHSARAREIMDSIFEFFRPTIEAVQGFLERLVHEVQVLVNVFQAGKGSVDAVAQAIDRLLGGSGDVAPVINGISEAIKAFVTWVDKVVRSTVGWKNVLIALGIALALVIAPIPTLIAGLILAYKRFQVFRDIVDATVAVIGEIAVAIADFAVAVVEQTKLAIDWLNTNVFPTFFALGELVAAIVNRIISVINFLWPVFRTQFNLVMLVVRTTFTIIQAIVTQFINGVMILWNAFGDNLLSVIQQAWAVVKTVVETALGIIRGIIQILTGLISGDWGKAWEGVKTIFTTIWNAIKAIVTIQIATIKNILDFFLSAIRAAWQLAWNLVKTIVSAAIKVIKDTISTGIGTVVGFFREMPGKITQALPGLAKTLLSKGRDIIVGLYNGIVDKFWTVIAWLSGLPGRILGAVGSLADSLVEIGKAIIEGLLRGMKSAWDHVTGWLSSLNPANWLNDINMQKGHAEKNLVPVGKAIMAGLQSSMEAGWKDTAQWLSTLDPSLLITPSLTPSAAGGGGDTFNFTIHVGDNADPSVAGTVKSAVMSTDVLQQITRAVRAGRR